VRERAWQRRAEGPSAELEPNPGHRALVDLERSGRLHTLITQNVDGLHQAAGSDPSLVVEVHGTVREVVCLDCGDRAPMAAALARVRAGEVDPPCRRCGGILKSATISFGQNLVPEDLQRADAAARACDLLLAVGSTLAVYPIADVVPLAVAHGARVVIVNGSPTAMDDLADAVVTGSISEVLPALMADLPPVD
jgi:NAD-dependent deacetylase